MLKAEKYKKIEESDDRHKRYPVYGIRLTPANKRWLEGELKALEKLIRDFKKDDEKAIRRNNIALEALKIGLGKIRADYERKK